MTNPLSFEAFQATRLKVDNLGKVLRDECLAFKPGLVYCQCTLFIEDTSPWLKHRDDGRWYTLIGNCEYQSDNLEEIERKLYEFAVSEGYVF